MGAPRRRRVLQRHDAPAEEVEILAVHLQRALHDGLEARAARPVRRNADRV